MGRVTVSAIIENLDDLYEVEKGQRAADGVRTVKVGDVIIDTGATALSLPKRFISQLGLRSTALAPRTLQRASSHSTPTFR